MVAPEGRNSSRRDSGEAATGTMLSKEITSSGGRKSVLPKKGQAGHAG